MSFQSRSPSTCEACITTGRSLYINCTIDSYQSDQQGVTQEGTSMALGSTFGGKEHAHHSALGRLDSALRCSGLRLPKKKLAMPGSKYHPSPTAGSALRWKGSIIRQSPSPCHRLSSIQKKSSPQSSILPTSVPHAPSPLSIVAVRSNLGNSNKFESTMFCTSLRRRKEWAPVVPRLLQNRDPKFRGEDKIQRTRDLISSESTC